MNSRQASITSVKSVLAIVVAYSRGLAISTLPGVFELMTVMIFIAGFCFGAAVGVSVGIISLSIYMLVPYPSPIPQRSYTLFLLSSSS
jgi:uncharacterized membrane protein